jgi:spore maturation protein CgeB
MNYYAENHEEREAIAQRGRLKVLNGHTQVQRVDTLLRAVGL